MLLTRGEEVQGRVQTIYNMLPNPFCQPQMSTAVNGQRVPADRRGSAFLFALERHGILCTVSSTVVVTDVVGSGA